MNECIQDNIQNCHQSNRALCTNFNSYLARLFLCKTAGLIQLLIQCQVSGFLNLPCLVAYLEGFAYSFLGKPPLNWYYKSRLFLLIASRSIFEKPWRVGSVKTITSLTPANGAAGLLLATPASSPASFSSKSWVQWCHCNSALSIQRSRQWKT